MAENINCEQSSYRYIITEEKEVAAIKASDDMKIYNVDNIFSNVKFLYYLPSQRKLILQVKFPLGKTPL